MVYLNGLVYKGCQGCEKCSSGGACIVNDDLTAVLEKLRDAEGWILASPIYNDGVTGQMKTFFDRCRTFTKDPDTQVLKPQLVGKRKGMIIVTYEDSPRRDYSYEAEKMANYLHWMGDFGEVEVVAEGNLGPVHAARDRTGLSEKLSTLGNRLFTGRRTL